jgi:hypothetical protein
MTVRRLDVRERTMSKKTTTEAAKKELQFEDVVISTLEFYYDGLSGQPKYRMKFSNKTKMVDPLKIYAMACVEVLQDCGEAIDAKMEEISGIEAWDDVVLQ